MDDSLQSRVDAALAPTADLVRWGVSIVTDGESATVRPAATMQAASIGKVFLLLAVARMLEAGDIALADRLAIHDEDAVADSGLLPHLGESELSVQALCVLTAAVSDNLASNMLLRRVGLSRSQAVSDLLGMPDSRQIDRIRNSRGPGDPPGPSQARAEDLASLMRRLGEGRAVSARADALVSGWLSLDTDLSMVASAFDLDPLAHADPSAPLRLMNKTGTDVGIRADCGLVCTEAHAISYAVLANWDDDEVAVTGAVLAAMREIGTALRRLA